MFGYLTANTALLTEEQLARYKAVYCGLCHTLRKRHGSGAGLTLNYDMTFLILLLNSLYEPEEAAGEERCIRHPGKAQTRQCSEMTEYAADLNVALSYLKCLDNWRDDGSVVSLAAGKLLRKSAERCEADYPRQYAAMVRSIEELCALEQTGTEDADAAAASFGAFMAEALVYREDRWSGTLRGMGMALGKFIYIMDAVMDLDSDAKSGSFNPFRKYCGLDNEERFRDILKMLLAECIFYFDRLPLVQDAELLKNILCFGLWQQFNAKFMKKKVEPDV